MTKEKKIAWLCLIAAGILELVWAYFMKQSHGFTILAPSVLAILFIAISFILLERAIRVFGIGMSYTVFTGIGIAGTTIIGIVVFGESVGIVKIVSLIILATGIIGLKYCGNQEEAAEEREEPKQ